MVDIKYPAVKSIVDIVNNVKEKVATVQPGEWIQGEGWNDADLMECQEDPRRKPAKEDLDRVSPDNPVVLTDYSGHRVWVNSKALELGGVTKDTPDEPGGRIERDSSGEPSGQLVETATRFVRRLIPPWTHQQRKDAIPHVFKELTSLGITSYTDAGVDRDKWAAYNDAYNEHIISGKWTCRVNMLTMLPGFGDTRLESNREALKYVGCRHNFGNEWLRLNGAKLIADGIPPLKTGWMYDDYIDGGVGGLVVEGDSPEEKEKSLRELISLYHENRFPIGIHCTGDRAIDVCVDQFMKCIEEDPWDARHCIIHSDFIREETIKKIAEFGQRTGYELCLNVQSAIKTMITDAMVNVVGEEREAYHWPLRTMLDNGIHVSDSSDAPVCYPDWKNGIKASILRESNVTGKVSGPEQCITVEEAIRNYTINGAWQDHMENIKGSIEVGKLADFCIIDGDILNTDPHKIPNLKTIMTIVGGRIVFDAKVL